MKRIDSEPYDYVLLVRGWHESPSFRGWVCELTGRRGHIAVLLPWSAFSVPRKNDDGAPVMEFDADYNPYVDFRPSVPPDVIRDRERPVLGGHTYLSAPFGYEARNEHQQLLFEIRVGDPIWLATDWTTWSLVEALPQGAQRWVNAGSDLVHGHRTELHEIPAPVRQSNSQPSSSATAQGVHLVRVA